MTKGPAWSVEEDALLRRHYPNKELKVGEVARIIGRSPAAVVARSNKLRINRSCGPKPKSISDQKGPIAPRTPPEMPTHPFWTPELDVRVFRTHGRWVSISELAAELGKPNTFVQQRFHRLSAEG